MTQGTNSAVAMGLAAVVIASATPSLAFEPILYPPEGGPTLRLSVISDYRGGLFSTKAVEGPVAYDPVSRKLFVPSQPRRRVEIIDISDPYNPLVRAPIELGAIGAGVAHTAFGDGLVAVAIQGLEKTKPGYVLFFDDGGDPLSAPVTVGNQPSMLAFTPDGSRLIVTNRGEATDDYTDDPEGTVSIIRLRERLGILTPEVSTIRFKRFNDQREQLVADGVRLTGPGASVIEDLEPESIALSANGKTAWVTLQRNNAIAQIDVRDVSAKKIFGLGAKDHSIADNGLDASDQDGTINITSWLLSAWYEPDMLAAYQVNGVTYLVTANEGDPRDFGESQYNETKRVAELNLDPIAFPDPDLADSENLGRLKVSAIEGDEDGDGDQDRLYAFGGRSFSIWTTTGELVFDSGRKMEQIIAEAIPDWFNTTDDANVFDSRSDDRGPEPEAMTVGEIDGRSYAFITFERIGGVMAFDITNPFAPRFEQYLNNRNFAIDPAEVCQKDQEQEGDCLLIGDLSPEGVVFISRADSPIDAPLLVMNHETSDSVSIIRIDPAALRQPEGTPGTWPAARVGRTVTNLRNSVSPPLSP
jgi:DNA-binding beta-propeller fold protein YncE